MAATVLYGGGFHLLRTIQPVNILSWLHDLPTLCIKRSSVFLKTNKHWPQMSDHEIYLTNDKHILKTEMLNFKESKIIWLRNEGSTMRLLLSLCFPMSETHMIPLDPKSNSFTLSTAIVLSRSSHVPTLWDLVTDYFGSFIFQCFCVSVHPSDPMDCSPPGSSVLGDSPGKNTGVGCHALL